MSVKLALRNISKAYDQRPAVRDLSLDVETGEFVALLGPSGCGKSTTLNILAGFEAPDSGEILVDGQSIAALPAHKRGIGLVLQDYAVFTRMSVRKNIAFGLSGRGLSRAARHARVDAFAERFELTNLLDLSAGSLNVGEMQRLALARTLATGPSLLLLDEPMSNLDAAVRLRLRQELKSIQREFNQTVIYVTHDQGEAMTMADRIAVMREGAIVQIGTPETIYNQPRELYIAQFIGEPPINLIPGEVREVRGRRVAVVPPFGELPIPGEVAVSGQVMAAIRPHHIHILGAPDSMSVPLVVEDIEDLGANQVLHFRIGETTVSAITSLTGARVGDIVNVAPDMRAIALIDHQTSLVVLEQTAQ
jgi:multiple sugar transport system ATP-binding protein